MNKISTPCTHHRAKANEPCFLTSFCRICTIISSTCWTFPSLFLAGFTYRAWEFFSCSKNSLPCRHIWGQMSVASYCTFLFPFFSHSTLALTPSTLICYCMYMVEIPIHFLLLFPMRVTDSGSGHEWKHK